MERIFGSENFKLNVKMPVVGIGNFDGVHLGHRHVIKTVTDTAKKINGTSLIYTFDPHPVSVLSPMECPLLIQTLNQKLLEIEKLGVDTCVIEKFTTEFAMQNAADFFGTVILKRLHASTIIVGYDFTFGVHRQGTIEKLEKLGKENNVNVIVINAQFAGETLVSSTNIRRLIEAGQVKEAKTLLGRHYEIEGTVISGRGFGRKIGTRTANIKNKNELVPKEGVYLTYTIIDKKTYPSITSIGNNPTFPNSSFTIETHLIDENIDLMGRTIVVRFVERMRGQIAFDSCGALTKQIQTDIEKAKELHGVNGEGLKAKDKR